ncbi:uncharacterized protein TNCT_270241 [Trichonephila clavata]|uniref:DUF7041 domain-containing protein n=1 Tax=Trichonephila clavata TaxID=2740835 RepID=A0A8X6LDU7_TRICU|nr:uncharacterized protein TNCT_270241 [Trichonephila clavata]
MFFAVLHVNRYSFYSRFNNVIYYEKKSENENDTSSIVVRVSIKPPPFWKPDPKIWFLQLLEAQFRNASITTDQTKYENVVSSIEAEILAQVTDILTNPPEDCKYVTIKERFITIFAETETQKTKKLLTDVELGDKNLRSYCVK